MLVITSKTKAFFSKKTSEKSKYLAGICTFLIINKVIWAFLIRSIGIKLKLKDVIYTTKALTFLSNAVLVNFFLLMIFNYLVIDKSLAVV